MSVLFVPPLTRGFHLFDSTRFMLKAAVPDTDVRRVRIRQLAAGERSA